MNKKYIFGGVMIIIAGIVLYACADTYSGSYYDVTWGICSRSQMEPIWQNPELSFAEAKAALAAQSGDMVYSRENLKERGFINCLEDDVRLQERMVESLMATLRTRPDATQSYYRNTDPDTCYWVYVKKR